MADPTATPTTNTAQNAAVNNTPVPTTAPSATSSDKTSSPTAIVSSKTAGDNLNDTVIPGMNNATSAIAQNQQAKALAAATPPPTTGTQAAPQSTGQPQQPTAPTPEETIANTPETGSQWLYGPDGSRIQNPLNQPVPPGYSTTNPKQAPALAVVNTATFDTGSYQQYQDGTYGRFDATGAYQGQATPQEFQDAQTAQSIKDGLNKALTGGYPLTPAQQAQIDGIQAEFKDLFDAQKLANANYTGGVTVAENLYGMGNGTVGLGAIKSSVDEGISKLASLTAKMLSQTAAMQQAFDDQNFAKLKDEYTIFNTAQKDRQAAIDNIQDKMTAAAKDARDYNLNVEKENLQAIMDDHTISYQDKQQALAQSQLSETERHNIQTEAVARQTALKGRYQYDSGTGDVFDTQTGQVHSMAPANVFNGAVTPGKTGNPLLDNNTQTSSAGVPYIDGTNFTGKQASEMQLAAAKLGIPYVGKEGAAALDNISAMKGDIGLMKSSIEKLNPSNGVTRPLVSIGHGIENFTQMGPGAEEVSSFNAYRESAIKGIQALASGGTGLRINQAEINTMMQNIPTYNDVQSVANAKLAKLSSMMDNNEKSVVGPAAFDQHNPDAAAKDLATFSQASPDHAAQIDKIRQSFPTLSPSQVLQLVQP